MSKIHKIGNTKYHITSERAFQRAMKAPAGGSRPLLKIVARDREDYPNFYRQILTPKKLARLLRQAEYSGDISAQSELFKEIESDAHFFSILQMIKQQVGKLPINCQQSLPGLLTLSLTEMGQFTASGWTTQGDRLNTRGIQFLGKQK